MRPPRVQGPLFADIERELLEHCHTGDPDTSFKAARGALHRAPASCRVIWKYLVKHGPKTDEELQHELAMFSAPKRRCDLLKRGLVQDSGKTRQSRQGADMTVWRAVV